MVYVKESPQNNNPLKCEFQAIKSSLFECNKVSKKESNMS